MSYTNATGVFNQHYRQVRAATTANITIASDLNNGDTLDGITLATGDMVLVKDQTASAENGIYIVGASPARDPSYNSDFIIRSSKILVREGTTNALKVFACTNTSAITVDSTSIYYTRTVRETITANTTLTVKATGGDFTTLSDALAYLAPYSIAGTAIVTISIDAGVFNLSATTINHTNSDRINITGATTYTKTMNSIQSSSGSSGNRSYIINMDSVTNVSVGDYIFLRDCTGGSNPTFMNGAWEITNVDTGNNRLTITNTQVQSSAASGNVTTSTAYIIRTVLSFASSLGINVYSPLYRLKNVVIKGNKGDANQKGLQIENAFINAFCFNLTVITNCYTGITIINGSSMAYQEPFAVCGNRNGLEISGGTSLNLGRYCTVTGNVDGTGISASGCSSVALGSNVCIGNTTNASPSVGTTGGNYGSYIY